MQNPYMAQPTIFICCSLLTSFVSCSNHRGRHFNRYVFRRTIRMLPFVSVYMPRIPITRTWALLQRSLKHVRYFCQAVILSREQWTIDFTVVVWKPDIMWLDKLRDSQCVPQRDRRRSPVHAVLYHVQPYVFLQKSGLPASDRPCFYHRIFWAFEETSIW